MQTDSARPRFHALLQEAASAQALVKLTLGNPLPAAGDLKNLFIRPVTLKKGPHLCLVWRHVTRDITKNLPLSEALQLVAELLGTAFLDAHLFTLTQAIELRCLSSGQDKLVIKQASASAPRTQGAHDRTKDYAIVPDSKWLQLLGITNERGAPRAEMSAKFRQIQNFSALLGHLLEEAALLAPTKASGSAAVTPPSFKVVDMGCGKGYLTFALADLLSGHAEVAGVEIRPELVDKCNHIAGQCGFKHLRFLPGSIQQAQLETPDVIIALHACDTATDDALARGIEAQAKVIVVSPCCHKQLRPALVPPPVLQGSLRHGIFLERQAEFVTDALRAELLEWAGYRTRVQEFISTEHTAKNLMITAIKVRPAGDPGAASRVRKLSDFYGIKQQALAQHLQFPLNT